MPAIADHVAVQAKAKHVLTELGESIGPRDTERTIASRARELLERLGITETWYYDCMAFVLLGSRSCQSISGREYKPADEPVGECNVVTIDLSPMLNGAWGDCARTFVIEGGRHTLAPATAEYRSGMDAEAALHKALRGSCKLGSTFHDVYERGNAEIQRLGYENLDFMGNLGHSIEASRDLRRYIERGNLSRLAPNQLFTYEPHIRVPSGKWGFKHEDIYYFSSSGELRVL